MFCNYFIVIFYEDISMFFSTTHSMVPFGTVHHATLFYCLEEPIMEKKKEKRKKKKCERFGKIGHLVA